MLHMMLWSRPDIINYVCECLMMMSFTMELHIKSMKRIMKCVANTSDGELLLKPNEVWSGGRDFLFKVTGMRNSEYAKDYLKYLSVVGILF